MNDEDDLLSPIEAIAKKPYDAHLDIEELEDADIAAAQGSMAAAAQADMVRQLLVGGGTSYDDLANQVGGVDPSDHLAETPNRIQSGESDTLRDDLVYQSPDWERAHGRNDNSVDDLIG